MKPRILFTTPVLGFPPSSGPLLRIANSIKALAMVSELHVISQVPSDQLKSEGEREVRAIAHAFSYAPFPVLSTPADNSANAPAIIEYARRHAISVVWLGYGNISFPLLRALKQGAPDLKVVVDTDSIWTRFLLRELPFCDELSRQRAIEKEGRLKMLEEEESARLADITTAVSEIDARYYRGIAPDPARVHVFSNVIDLDAYSSLPPRPNHLPGPYVYVAGSFYGPNAPMTEATRWMAQAVWPLIKTVVPDATLVVLGNGADKQLRSERADIVIQGYVDSVLPFLKNASVAAVPLRFESGTRFKILEAAACGVPIVSTTLGAEGIPLIPGRDFLVGDTAEQFAEACVALLQNQTLGTQLAQHARALVEQKYTVRSLAEEANLILQALGHAPHSRGLQSATCITEAALQVL